MLDINIFMISNMLLENINRSFQWYVLNLRNITQEKGSTFEEGFLNNLWQNSEQIHTKLKCIVLQGTSLSTFEIFDVARGQNWAFCSLIIVKPLSKFYFNLFLETNLVYFLITKDSLMGKV